MTNYLELAQLLEQVAMALREAHGRLSVVYPLSDPIDVRAFSIRTRNILHREGIDTWGGLTSQTEMDLLSLRNAGKSTVHEVREILRKRGLHLKGEAP